METEPQKEQNEIRIYAERKRDNQFILCERQSPAKRSPSIG